MTKYFLYPFGTAGDLTAVPDATQVSGSVSYQQGWGLNYQLDLATNPSALPLSRAQTNQLFYDVTTNIQQYQQHGVPEFILASQNLGVAFPYAKYAIVRYNDGGGYKNYISLIDNNTDTPPSANWQFLDPAADKVPAGAMLDFAGTVAPTGYLGCDGSAVSRTTYATLFAAIGITWGSGDGSTTFNLPDFRRRTAVGSGGTASEILGNTVGSVGGEEAHTQTIEEMPSHDHSPGVLVDDDAVGSGGSFHAYNNNTLNPVRLPVPAQGGGTAFNVMQPSAVVLKIIKT